MKRDQTNRPINIREFLRRKAQAESSSASTGTAEQRSSPSPSSWFWGILKQFWPIYAQVILAAVLVNGVAIVGPLFTMSVYDRIVPHGELAQNTLHILAVGVLIIFSFDFFLKVLRSYFVDLAGRNADVILASRVFSQIMNMKLSARPHSVGSFAHQLREYETLRAFFSSMTLVAFIDLPFIVMFMGVIYLIGGPVVYVPMLALGVVVIASCLIHRPLKNWINRLFHENEQKHALLVESMNGLETIKSLGLENRTQNHWEHFVHQASGSSLSAQQISSIATHLASYVYQVCTVGVIIVGVWQIFQGQMTMGSLIACSILTGRTLAPMGQVVGLLTRLSQSITALKSLNKILQMPLERKRLSTFLPHTPITGQITFQNVCFQYPDQPTTALKNVSFTIKPGEKIALIGRIGSGKSTVEKMILGLYEPKEGNILIDQTDTRTIDPADLRAHIGYVPQDIFLFSGSVRDNIMMGASLMNEEAFARVVKVAGVDEFALKHPLGYDMPVGEAGRLLSGGQRQSIAIARALIRNPSILLFDEPTAMMDHASETRFIEKIQDSLTDKTLILITHRMSLLSVVDRVIIMDNGQVVADGPRDLVLKSLSNAQIYRAGGM